MTAPVTILRHGDGVSDRDGFLYAREPADQARLERLIADALPTSSAVAVNGSMLLRRASMWSQFVVHVKPVSVPADGLWGPACRRPGADCRAGAHVPVSIPP